MTLGDVVVGVVVSCVLYLIARYFWPAHSLSVHRIPSIAIDSVLFGELWVLRKAYWPEDSKRKFIGFIKGCRATWVMFRDVDDGSLRGAYTEEIVEGEVDGIKFKALYLGHLFFYTYYRGTPASSIALLGTLLRIWWNTPSGIRFFTVFSPISYKSYLIAAHSYPNMYPTRKNCDSIRFKTEKGIANSVMSKLYPEYWNGTLISIPGIKLDVAPVTEEMLKESDDIRFFVERNPTHDSGSALPCIFEVTLNSMVMTITTTMKRALFSRSSKKSRSRSDHVRKPRPKQRDLARTWTMPLETDISRTFNLQEKTKKNVQNLVGRLKKADATIVTDPIPEKIE